MGQDWELSKPCFHRYNLLVTSTSSASVANIINLWREKKVKGKCAWSGKEGGEEMWKGRKGQEGGKGGGVKERWQRRTKRGDDKGGREVEWQGGKGRKFGVASGRDGGLAKAGGKGGAL